MPFLFARPLRGADCNERVSFGVERDAWDDGGGTKA
jgi:hypothetical protein